MFERLLKIFLPVAFGVALQTFSANALGGSIVIAQVQAGSAAGDGAATQEFISLYNNSDAPIDVTNWCLSNKAGVSFACLSAPDASTMLNVAPHGYALIASDSFAARYAGTYDTVFTTTNKTSGSVVGGSDTLTLLDANGAPIDAANWTTSLPGGSVLTRQRANQKDGTMLDTNAASDFTKMTSLVVPVSGVSEVTHIIDVCANLDGAQAAIPAGYGLVGSDCVADVCPNIDGLQEAVPEEMKINDSRCLYDLPPLLITELLPNASGSDTGSEFIELFNPNNASVDLSPYRLQVGQNFEKTYSFAAETTMQPQSYMAFFNESVGFSLLNTSSRARLISVDGQVISEAPAYFDPAENEAWAFLSDTWMFTNQPTPGLANLLPTDLQTSAGVTIASSLKPCAANQYRSPDTNRCRTITTDTGDIKPCKDGQYRSEETSRCRSIVSDVSAAKACADDQFRNPATGRCKKIASEDEVKDCGEGRERNPVTKRCRNIISTASATTASGVKMVPAPAANVLGWLVGAVVALVALSYAVFEWHREMVRWLRCHIARATLFVRRLRYNKSNEDNWN